MIISRSTSYFFLPLAVLLVSPVAAFAANSFDPSRDQFIQEKLDCLNTSEESRWDELCSLSDADRRAGVPAKKESREEIIARALDAAADKRSVPPSVPLPVWTVEESPGQLAAIELKMHETEFGTEIYRYSYKEPIFNLEIKGLQFGVFGSYTYRPDEGDSLYLDVLNMYKIDARFAAGPVDYSSNGSGQLDNEDNYAFELRGIAGYDHLVNERFLLAGYGGLGFRYLNNDSGGRRSTTGAYGYERVSNYFYLPLGVTAVNQITSSWKISSNLEWDIFLYGEQTSYLSDVSSGYPDPENDQDRGYGVRGSVRIVKEGSGLDLFFEPFFRYWRIHDSEVSTSVGNDYIVTGYEPDNSTTEYGFKFGLQY